MTRRAIYEDAMDADTIPALVAIGRVESPLRDPAAAPKQGPEGAPDAWLVFEPRYAPGLDGIQAGDEVLVLTWLDRARRDVLRVHPRDDLANPERGVFSTRSADRPNPIGLHRVEVLAIDGLRFHVRNLEAIDATPILDVKPVLTPPARERRLRATYDAFNSRDIDAVLRHMTADVDWPNAWEGGRLRGRAAVRDYWTRQWAAIDPAAHPVAFTPRPDGRLAVEVDQIVRDLDGAVVSLARVRHVFRFAGGLVAGMDVEEPRADEP
jgi:tRNA-Thr(GGU) m(6)t(6)A37 methyltransferase TsaA